MTPHLAWLCETRKQNMQLNNSGALSAPRLAEARARLLRRHYVRQQAPLVGVVQLDLGPQAAAGAARHVEPVSQAHFLRCQRNDCITESIDLSI